jgi:hypothetical protein
MEWRPRHPSCRPCALCGKQIPLKHPPYLITKGQRILGPYHNACWVRVSDDLQAGGDGTCSGAGAPRSSEEGPR